MANEKPAVRIEARFTTREALEIERRAAAEQRSVPNYLRHFVVTGLQLGGDVPPPAPAG
jgi:hypothetical protein